MLLCVLLWIDPIKSFHGFSFRGKAAQHLVSSVCKLAISFIRSRLFLTASESALNSCAVYWLTRLASFSW